MTRNEVLDLHFLEARHKLVEIGAFLDRVARAEGEADFRLASFQAALAELVDAAPDKARRALVVLSDPTTEPIAKATGQSACGAWPGFRALAQATGGRPQSL